MQMYVQGAHIGQCQYLHDQPNVLSLNLSVTLLVSDLTTPYNEYKYTGVMSNMNQYTSDGLCSFLSSCC